MKKKANKKLVLNKETLAQLKKVTGGYQELARVESEGPVICYFSDCNPCDTDMQCGTY